MAPTYLDEAPAEKIGKGDEEGGKTTADREALTAQIPKEIRAAFATKVWTLLAGQMSVTFILSLVVEIVAKRPEDPSKRVLIWVGSSVVAFIFLGILRFFRDKPGLNYFFLCPAILFMAIFWGLTKFVVQGFFNINVTGMVTLSLLLSAVCNCCGITDSLGEKLKPKGGRARPSQRGSQMQMAQSQSGGAQGNLKRSQSKLGSFKQSLVTEVRLQNDGVMRATMLLGIVTWFIAFVVCLVITLLLKSMYDNDTATSMTKQADMKSALAGGVLAFFMLIFFHYDCDRHMRKCDFDKPLKAIISINCDIVIIFLLIYLVAVILACNEQSLELQGEGGGGGDMGAGADGGGMEGGAGADAAGAEPVEVDRVFGGDGV